jgi:hypothetical protein
MALDFRGEPQLNYALEMRFYRQLITILLGLFILAAGLGLYCHKDLIQCININTIISENLDGRLAAHRINRIDRLRAVIESGVRAFEVDLLFRQAGSDGYFEVGHDEADTREVRLDQFLDILQPYHLDKIWLDIKQVSEDNLDAVLAELARLDAEYELRQTAIIESSITSDGFKKIKSAGFHTAYYLPTGQLLTLVRENNRVALEASAEALRRQIESQSTSAISFDLTLYPFVKTYLEPIIPDSIAYHAWGSVKMWEWDALDELKESDYFKDVRLKTILYGYWGSGCFSLLRADGSP